MFDATINLLKNRLYITLGRARKDQVVNSVSLIEEKVRQLSPGFTCITRFIDIREITEEDIHAIAQVQQLLSEHGISRAVRIGIDEGKELLNRVGQDVSYITTYAKSLKKAEEVLDEWERRND